MVKYNCDNCGREMPTPKEATDKSCWYHEFKTASDIEIHIAYRSLSLPHKDMCPRCLLDVLINDFGVLPPPKRRIE